jgi:lysophospholipase L1-like esterase
VRYPRLDPPIAPVSNIHPKRIWGRAAAVAALLLVAACERPAEPAAAPVPRLAAPQAEAPAEFTFPAPASGGSLRVDVAAARGDERRTGDLLAPFYHRLSLLQAGRADRLVILQIGDSHTAGGILGERMRELMQSQFGASGRGMMVAGKPFNGIRQTDIKLSEVGKWQHFGSLKQDSQGPFGLTGYRARSRAANSALVLEATDERGFDQIAVEFVRAPGHGMLEVLVDGRPVRRVATDARRIEAQSFTLPVPTGSRELRLVARDRQPVEVLSWTVERRQRGVIVETHGVSGAMADIVTRWDPQILARELRERDPALIILAYGTNESVKYDLDLGKYELMLRDVLRLFRAAAPNAALMLVGPPDVNQAVGCGRNGSANATICVPASQSRGDMCRWQPPPLLDGVRETQLRAAQAERAYYWDWWALMGGICGMHRWVIHDPPYARPDHVHMNVVGYRVTAEALYETLMRGYTAWRRPPAPRRGS